MIHPPGRRRRSLGEPLWESEQPALVWGHPPGEGRRLGIRI